MLELDTSPRKYFPKVYDEVLEIDELSNTENEVFKEALARLNDLWKNSFVITCDEVGIAKYEKVLNIIPDPATEDLMFRRNRVLNRFSMIPAFTMPWLRVRLDELLGAGNWAYTIDYANHEFVVETVEQSQVWLHEVSATIHQVKPASLTFISRPMQQFILLVNEDVEQQTRVKSYQMGLWKLGEEPFAVYSDSEEIKMAETPSIQPALLRHLATFTASDVASVLVNDKVEIPRADFIRANSEGELTCIEYEVRASEGLGTITNAKLRDNLGNVLTSINVSIDNTFNVRMRHNIRFKEGTNAETA